MLHNASARGNGVATPSRSYATNLEFLRDLGSKPPVFWVLYTPMGSEFRVVTR